MKYIADLHIHSKYSRSVSPRMDVENLDLWGVKKGIDIIGTGDFTHPEYFKELKDSLVESEQGLFRYKYSKNKTRFILQTELCTIYKKFDKCRRLHTVFLMPSLESVEKFNKYLEKKEFNLKSDGRPILGIDVLELTKIALDIDEKTLVIPAHIWTPWFALFGSKSGFDALQDCFDDYSKYIYAVETGLSSDPMMNWHLSALDDLCLVSNSDAHSLNNLGREANVFDLHELSYDEIYNTLKNKNKEKFLYTIEFFPEEGKYHFDGHRSCNISFDPKETKKHKGLCPTCGKKLTIGVYNRVFELADRDEPKIEGQIPFKSIVPLREIIAESMGRGVNTKGVNNAYDDLIDKGLNEFSILLDLPIEQIKKQSSDMIAEGIKRVRDGKVIITPGYDGEYGKIKVFSDQEKSDQKPTQKALF